MTVLRLHQAVLVITAHSLLLSFTTVDYQMCMCEERPLRIWPSNQFNEVWGSTRTSRGLEGLRMSTSILIGLGIM